MIQCKRKLLFLMLCIICLCSFSKTVFVVPWQANDDGDGLSWNNAKKTIASALSISESGDQIFATVGLFSEGGFEIPEGITVYGGFSKGSMDLNSRDYADSPSTIDALGFSLPITLNGTLDGFHIKNTLCPVITNTQASARILNCRFYNNCTISTAESIISFYGTMVNCLIYANYAAGTGIHLHSGAVLESCTIVNNGKFPMKLEAGVTFSNTIASGNTGRIDIADSSNINYCLFDKVFDPPLSGVGNLTATTPVFIDPTPTSNGNADYRFASGSPGIDKGGMVTVPTDYYQMDRPYFDGLVDIGACEYNQAPAVSVTSPRLVQVVHTATHFMLEGTCSDRENEWKKIRISYEGTSWSFNETSNSWSYRYPIKPSPFDLTIKVMDEGGVESTITETFTIETVIPTCAVITPSSNMSYIEYSQSSLTFDVTATDDQQISQIQYRMGNSGAWLSSSDHTDDNWHFLLTDIPLGQSTVQIKSIDSDGYESAVVEKKVTRLKKLIGDFTVSKTSAAVNTRIDFYDGSSGDINSWKWDFNNDGVIDSTTRNSTWYYNDPGIYAVSLTVVDSLSQKTETKEALISVYPADAADYNAQVLSDTIPVSMRQNESCSVDITMKNTGKLTWFDSQLVYLGAVGDSDPLICSNNFLRASAHRDVRYGETGTFSIEMKPLLSGVQKTDWRMIVEGVAWFGDILSKDVSVQPQTNVKNQNWQMYQ